MVGRLAVRRRRTPSVCAVPGCPNITRDQRCADCRRQYERKRGSSTARGYDAEWRAIRRRYLEAHPRCEECGAPATEVDHIDGQGPRGSNAWENLKALCKPCHSRKTVDRDGGLGRGP